MSHDLATHAEAPTTRRQRRGLLAGLLVAPLTWLAHLGLSYALVPWTCARGHRSVLLLVSAAALAVAASGGVAAWNSWPSGRPRAGEPRDIEGARLLSLLGLVLSLSFIVALLASAIPTLVLRPCD